jgi:hypothetical protein
MLVIVGKRNNDMKLICTDWLKSLNQLLGEPYRIVSIGPPGRCMSYLLMAQLRAAGPPLIPITVAHIDGFVRLLALCGIQTLCI